MTRFAEACGDLVEDGHEHIRRLVRTPELSLDRVLRGGFGLSIDANGRRLIVSNQTRRWRELARPFGRVLFAGEHAGESQGYMDGAIESGLRAARGLEALERARRWRIGR
ncbi:MAG TPA: FAD-dependent oxidoreductase [Vicinamibacterales bacterium]|nr:FAD-dependent oxidoreductase [Vicinamibacterales bacterium]